MRRLHITNGDSASNTLAASTVAGQTLPWRDCLHEGPVPGGLSREALADVRARHLAHPRIGGYPGVRRDFAARDAHLDRLGDYDEVVLWFEHDLYDQLQLLQILDRLAARDLAGPRLTMICIDRFPGVEPFHGLGQLDSVQMASLLSRRRPIDEDQLRLGSSGWQAFTAPAPDRIQALLREDPGALPFLAPALGRLLEEYPSTRDGLGRTQRQTLQCVALGVEHPERLFAASQEREQARFMGDWSFWKLVDGLCRGAQPLLACAGGNGTFRHPPDVTADQAFRNQRLGLTDTGRAVLEAGEDQVALNGIDLWIGGVHLKNGGPLWRWDAGSGRAIPTSF